MTLSVHLCVVVANGPDVAKESPYEVIPIDRAGEARRVAGDYR